MAINFAAFFYSDRFSDNMCGWNATGNFLCWGGNGNGELGDGTNTSRANAATTTNAGTQGANAIVQSTGDATVSTCALTSSGAVYCSGGNSNYDLGNGTAQSLSFIQPVGLSSGIVQLKSGTFGYCGLTTGGTLYCWGTQGGGANSDWGPSTAASYSTPTAITTLSGLANISGQSAHTCAITTAGGLTCWGLFYSDTTNTSTSWSTQGSSPATLTGFSNPIQITSGGQFSLFLNAAGQVAGFGDNVYYQLASTGGDQVSTTLTTISSSTLSSVVQISASGNGGVSSSGYAASVCALFASGSVSCWGANNQGQLGQGTTGSNIATPTAVSSITNAVALFGIGSQNTVGNGFCAALKTGSYVCWGAIYSGLNTPTITTISGLP